jgi:hypothetical protein
LVHTYWDGFTLTVEELGCIRRSALAKEDKLKMKYIPGNSPLRGGGDRSQENQQILGPSDDDDDHDGNPHTGNILDQLPKKERKRLLKVPPPPNSQPSDFLM